MLELVALPLLLLPNAPFVSLLTAQVAAFVMPVLPRNFWQALHELEEELVFFGVLLAFAAATTCVLVALFFFFVGRATPPSFFTVPESVLLIELPESEVLPGGGPGRVART